MSGLSTLHHLPPANSGEMQTEMPPLPLCRPAWRRWQTSSHYLPLLAGMLSLISCPDADCRGFLT